jgi:CubicO group peptidase (beta-lactamase class C family)
MGSISLLAAALTCTTLCLNTHAQTGTTKFPSNSKEAIVGEVDSYLRGLEGSGFSGTVLLAQDGGVLLKRGYGLADRASKRPVASETGFGIGSLVKSFTAVAIFKLEMRLHQGSLTKSTCTSRFSNQRE